MTVLSSLRTRALASLIPPPRQQLSEWIESNIRLPEGVSALPRVRTLSAVGQLHVGERDQSGGHRTPLDLRSAPDVEPINVPDPAPKLAYIFYFAAPPPLVAGG